MEDLQVDNFSVFPNPVPADGAFRLKSREGIIFLFDVHGREVLKKELSPGEALSTSGLKQGLYLITHQDRQGKISRGSLVVE
jgi:hypothetical protein